VDGPARHPVVQRPAATGSLTRVEEEDQPDLATRQSDIAAAMEETERRQEALRKRQDALLEQLQKLDRALDRDKPEAG
jgi:hypothetical protein